MSEIEGKKKHTKVTVSDPIGNEETKATSQQELDSTKEKSDPAVNKSKEVTPSHHVKRKSKVTIHQSTHRSTSSVRKSRLMGPGSVGSMYTMTGLLTRQRPGQRTLQPTYRLESTNPMNLDRVYTILREVILNAMANPYHSAYHATRTPKLAQDLAFEIRTRVKLQSFNRIRIIVIVTIIEKFKQSLICKMGFMWGSDEDRWISYEYDTDTYLLRAIVLGVYFD